MFRFTPQSDRVLPEFLAALLCSSAIRRDIWFEQVRGFREGLTPNSIRSLKSELPNIDLQQEIRAVLHDQTKNVALVTNAASKEIELLHKYRAHLIANVVTGKLDVRKAASALPNPDPLESSIRLDDPSNANSALVLDEVTAVA